MTSIQLWRLQDTSRQKLDIDTAEYDGLRFLILKCERILLHTMSFDLCVEHPYKPLIDTVKGIHSGGMIQDNTVRKELAQKAVSFLNDSMRTRLCLEFSAPKIASACIYLAAAFLDLQIPPSQAVKWDEKLNLNEHELTSICEKIFDGYSSHIYSDKSMRDLELRLIERGLLELPRASKKPRSDI